MSTVIYPQQVNPVTVVDNPLPPQVFYLYHGRPGTPGEDGDVPEAPIDGQQYGRQDGAWTVVSAGVDLGADYAWTGNHSFAQPVLFSGGQPAITFPDVNSTIERTGGAQLQFGGSTRVNLRDSAGFTRIEMQGHNNIGLIAVGASGYFAFADNDSPTAGTKDVQLHRDGPDQLGLRRGANEQKLRIYGVYDNATDYMAGVVKMFAAATGLVFDTEAAGSYAGTAANIMFRQLGSDRFNIGNNQLICHRTLAPNDGTRDLGTATTQRWSTVYGVNADFSGTATLGGLPTSDPVIAGQLWSDNGNVVLSGHTPGGGGFDPTADQTITGNWTFSGTNNELLQHNGANGQKYRIFKSYTDNANYESLVLDASTTGSLRLYTESAGTGANYNTRIAARSSTSNVYVEIDNQNVRLGAGGNELTLKGTVFSINTGNVALGKASSPFVDVYFDLPTADPLAAGKLWSNGGVVNVSAG